MKSIGNDDHSYSERAAGGELDVEKGAGGPDCVVEPTLVHNDTSQDHDGNVMELRSKSMNKSIDNMPMYKRIRVEISGMNAYVPDIFAKPSLREKLDPLGLFRKNASETGKKQKMKQVMHYSFRIERHFKLPVIELFLLHSIIKVSTCLVQPLIYFFNSSLQEF